MGFGTAITTCFGKFATFQGRAARSEFWYFMLFWFLGELGCSILDAVTGIGVVSLIFSLVTLIPGLAVSVRRLHDTDRSGWWYLLYLIPLVGAIILVIWFCARGTAGGNRFGDDPLAPAAAAEAEAEAASA